MTQLIKVVLAKIKQLHYISSGDIDKFKKTFTYFETIEDNYFKNINKNHFHKKENLDSDSYDMTLHNYYLFLQERLILEIEREYKTAEQLFALAHLKTKNHP